MQNRAKIYQTFLGRVLALSLAFFVSGLGTASAAANRNFFGENSHTSVVDICDFPENYEGSIPGGHARCAEAVQLDTNTIIPVRKFRYTKNGDLIEVYKKSVDDTSWPGIAAEKYEYHVNRKIKSIVKNGVRSRFYVTLEGDKIALKKGGTGKVQTFLESHLRMEADQPRYMYAAEVEDSDIGGEPYAYVRDYQQNVVAVASPTQMMEKRDYNPFGDRFFTAEASNSTDRDFNGQIRVADLHSFPARMYDGEDGVFLQADTIVPEVGEPGSYNRYAFGHQNSLKNVDPSGRELITALVLFTAQMAYQAHRTDGFKNMEFGEIASTTLRAVANSFAPVPGSDFLTNAAINVGLNLGTSAVDEMVYGKHHDFGKAALQGTITGVVSAGFDTGIAELDVGKLGKTKYYAARGAIRTSRSVVNASVTQEIYGKRVGDNFVKGLTTASAVSSLFPGKTMPVGMALGSVASSAIRNQGGQSKDAALDAFFSMAQGSISIAGYLRGQTDFPVEAQQSSNLEVDVEGTKLEFDMTSGGFGIRIVDEPKVENPDIYAGMLNK